jgi:hypothetical protein
MTPITNLYERVLNRAVVSDAERLNWTRLIECCIFALGFDMQFQQTISKLERYVYNSNLKSLVCANHIAFLTCQYLLWATTP